MAGKRETPEDLVLKRRQVEGLQGRGKSVSDAVRQIGVTVQTACRWRKDDGGMNRDQLKRLKSLSYEEGQQTIRWTVCPTIATSGSGLPFRV